MVFSHVKLFIAVHRSLVKQRVKNTCRFYKWNEEKDGGFTKSGTLVMLGGRYMDIGETARFLLNVGVDRQLLL